MEGHEKHLQNLKKIALNFGFKDAKVIKDLTRKDRFLILRK